MVPSVPQHEYKYFVRIVLFFFRYFFAAAAAKVLSRIPNFHNNVPSALLLEQTS
jgi:hypothetical protein